MADLIETLSRFAAYEPDESGAPYVLGEEHIDAFKAALAELANYRREETRLIEKIERLEAALKEIRDVAACSEGVEFYYMLANKALEVSDE